MMITLQLYFYGAKWMRPQRFQTSKCRAAFRREPTTSVLRASGLRQTIGRYGGESEFYLHDRTLSSCDKSNRCPDNRTLSSCDKSNRYPDNRTLSSCDKSNLYPDNRTLSSCDKSNLYPDNRTLLSCATRTIGHYGEETNQKTIGHYCHVINQTSTRRSCDKSNLYPDNRTLW